MSVSKITKRATDYTQKEDVVPVLSREYNLLVDEVNSAAALDAAALALKAPLASPTFTGTVTVPDVVKSGHTNGQVFLANGFSFYDPATTWTGSFFGAALPASQTSQIVTLPLNFLKVGDEIVSYKLLGDVDEVAACTLDCKLIKILNTDPIAIADVTGGAITQITADGDFAASKTLTAPEVVAADTFYAFYIVGTTGVGDSIYVAGAAVTINRK